MVHGVRIFLTENPKLEHSTETLSFANITCLQGVDDKDPSKSGIMIVEFEFSPPTSLNYVNIQYNSSDLEQHVERNPSILRSVVTDLRSRLKI